MLHVINKAFAVRSLNINTLKVLNKYRLCKGWINTQSEHKFLLIKF